MIERKRSGEALANDVGDLEPIDCSLCGDRGFITVRGELEQCKCGRSAREVKLRDSVGDLPVELQQASLINFVCEDTGGGISTAYSRALDVLHGALLGLLLEGDPGLGKSHLAAALVREFRKLDCLARFVFVPDLMAELRQAINSNDSFDALVDGYGKYGFLVLDDLGRGRWNPTAFEVEVITRIIQARYAGDQPFVITTNLTFDQVAKYYGQGVADRMWNANQTDRFQYVQLTGNSKRTNINYSDGLD